MLTHGKSLYPHLRCELTVHLLLTLLRFFMPQERFRSARLAQTSNFPCRVPWMDDGPDASPPPRAEEGRTLEEIFIPSEEIAADEEVTFPINI